MKRKQRFKNQEKEEDPEFQVAPMADVLFVLLIFFISITSTEVLRKEAGLVLPDAKKATEAKKNAGQVVINLSWFPLTRTSTIKVNSQTYGDSSALVPMLQNQLSLNPQTRVLIRADRDVEYSNVADVMKACAAANIGNVTFAVITGGEQGGESRTN